MTALVLLDHVDGHVTPASRSAITAAAHWARCMCW